MTEKRFKYIHPECGKVAFYLTKFPTDYHANSDEVILVDGDRPKKEDLIICGSCEKLVLNLLTKNIKQIRRWQDV